MEKRKETISALKMCRFCLCQDSSVSSLYDGNQKTNKTISLPLKILACLAIEIFPSDKMPTYICKRCHFFVDLFHEFKQLCRRADERILQYIQNGTSLETLIWPQSLTKVFCYAFKNIKKQQIVKTVVEGGATVQVTSQDGSNTDDEEEENVYNIKIGDSGNGSKCIKVVTSKNDADPKELTKPNRKDNDSQQMGTNSSNRNNFEDGCWPCDECDCTYSLQQLLELHKKQKHRERTVSCNQCDAKFFSKYDLMSHLWRHTDEMPFQCVACDRKFKRLVLLKRHEKLMHSDIPQLSCPNCPATFLSIEELEAHQKKHVRHAQRTHACLDCDKKFHDKTTLLRHMDVIHYKKPSFHCEYCPEQYTSISKLARHVRSHAGDRPHPCKYCNKSFMKSHHYTRHLRLKHPPPLRPSRGPFGSGGDSYRCEQCEETFNTQDELIYHSAIHATQNLTCPLCQEKFDDVEAVTAHIKTHVYGNEFMCDLCELVFTTKEKLENHLTVAHADEIANELGQDESSMELDGDEYEDDNGINLKEENGEMVVEIKKSGDFMVESEDKPENSNSEESEGEMTYAELETVDTLAMVRKDSKNIEVEKAQPEASKAPAVVTVAAAATPTSVLNTDNQTASILRKAEEVKRKVQQSISEGTEKQVKAVKVESSNPVGGASDKSLRLLEKELQELKRTNTRNETTKNPAKPVENLRNRRPQLYTSTPKTRATEEKKTLLSNKTPTMDKKVVERRVVTKENKEPKDTKENKQNVFVTKEDKEREVKEKEAKEKEFKEKEVKEKEVKEKEVKEKEVKEKEVKEKDIKEKEVREKELKEKETPKNIVKNGANDKSQPEDSVRRSTRPSKIKDYAKMIRDKSQDSSDDEDSDDADYEESKEVEKNEIRSKQRRASMKAAPMAKSPTIAATTTPPPGTRKRGRPRKETKELPSKMKKEENEDKTAELSKTEKSELEDSVDKTDSPTDDKGKDKETTPEKETETGTVPDKTNNSKINKSPSAEEKMAGAQLTSPSGQTLKKVPIKAIPPGIKPLPLPMRPLGSGELCEMQIGKKVVKVQKIVMTKAEVEAMAKKGLVEMKDGTMVLKQGIKLSSSDSLKASLIGEKDAVKEPRIRANKPATSQSTPTENT